MIGLALLFSVAALAGAQETLNYSVNWPSGLSLGEASLASARSTRGWDFQFDLEAYVPGFAVNDSYKSAVNSGFCSLTFEKATRHGVRASIEKSTFGNGSIRRETLRGGASEIKTGECARDALAFLFFLRRELRQGRLPGQQTIYSGAPYRLKLQFAGTQPVAVGEARVEADRIAALLKGPASEISFEIFFDKSDARTPLLVRVPLAIGVLSIELVQP